MDAPVSLSHISKLNNYFKRSKLKWLDAGLKLGLDQDTLKAIQKSHHGEEECFKAMLKLLIKDPRQPTMRDVLKVLDPRPRLPVPLTSACRSELETFSNPLPSPKNLCFRITSDRIAVPTRYRATELPLYTDLPAVERQQLIVSLQEQTLAIREEFEAFVSAILEEILTSHVPHDSMLKSFTLQVVCLIKQHLWKTCLVWQQLQATGLS